MKKFLAVLALAVASVSAYSYAEDVVVAPKVVPATQAVTPPSTRPAPVVDRNISNEIRALGQLKDLTAAQKTNINKVLTGAVDAIKAELTSDQVKALDEAAKAPRQFGPKDAPRKDPKAAEAKQ